MYTIWKTKPKFSFQMRILFLDHIYKISDKKAVDGLYNTETEAGHPPKSFSE